MPFIDIPYWPRGQFQNYHDRDKRWAVIVAHRRCGKTVACINDLIIRAANNPMKEAQYAYIAPLYNQAKDIAWRYLKRFTAPIPGVVTHEQELRVDLPNGARIRLYGADNPERLRGIYLDGVVLDEYAQMATRLFPEIIRPALADRGGWATFIGTPMGENAFSEIYQLALSKPDEWYSALLKVSETNLLPIKELEDARRLMSQDQYDREFECSFAAAIPGAYYAKLIERAQDQKRISKVHWEPRLPVHTAWDLGIDDMTAIWFIQEAHNEIRVIDYYESSGVGLSHYASQLSAGDRSEWVYGRHLLPHDAAVRELGTGKSRVEILKDMGIKATVVPASQVSDGIEASRVILPRCWFDAEKCSLGLKALRQYRCDWDERTNQPKPKPLHDWTSHAADAFRTYAMGARQTAPVALQRTKRLAEGAGPSYWGFT